MITPNGLTRFQRTIRSKRDASCFFCNATTVAGLDYAVLDNGKWFGVCVTHASSTLSQCKALVISLQTVSATLTEEALAAVAARIPTNLADVLAGSAGANAENACATALTEVLAGLNSAAPAAVRINKFAGCCGTCKVKVFEGAGRIERNEAGKWITYHLDGQCVTTAAPVAAPAVVVPEGRYALRSDDGVKFYRVEHGAKGGKWEGFVFVSVQASDDLHPIRNKASRQAILDAIAGDLHGAVALYGQELGVCGRCGKTLTDEASRASGIGPVCASKAW